MLVRIFFKSSNINYALLATGLEQEFQTSMKESTLYAGKVELLSKGINDFQTVQLPKNWEVFSKCSLSREYRLCPTFKICLSRKHVLLSKDIKQAENRRLKLAQTTNNLTYLSLPYDQPKKSNTKGIYKAKGVVPI